MLSVPPDEANRIKIAFAEGYIAANPTQSQGSTRTYRWLRTLQQVLAIAVFTAILASLMGSFGGGMFRVNVGSGNEVQPEDIKVTFNDVKGVGPTSLSNLTFVVLYIYIIEQRQNQNLHGICTCSVRI